MNAIYRILFLTIISFGMCCDLAAKYDITLIKPENGEADFVRVFALNDQGYVVGQYGDRAFFFHPSLGFQLLMQIESKCSTGIFVNNQALIAGVLSDTCFIPEREANGLFVYDILTGSYWNCLEPLKEKGVVDFVLQGFDDSGKLLAEVTSWDANTTNYIQFFTIDYPSGELREYYQENEVCLINNQGQMAGCKYFYDPIKGKKAIDQHNSEISHLTPQCMSSNGYVSGIAHFANRSEKGFSWHPEQGFKILPLILNYEKRIMGVNDYGEVIANGKYHAFCFNPKQGLIDLNTLGGKFSEANAINHQSQIVGWAEKKNEVMYAIIWDPKQGMQDLNSFFKNNKEIRLIFATKINNNGWIIAQGSYKGKLLVTFLLTPLE